MQHVRIVVHRKKDRFRHSHWMPRIGYGIAPTARSDPLSPAADRPAWAILVRNRPFSPPGIARGRPSGAETPPGSAKPAFDPESRPAMPAYRSFRIIFNV